MEKKCFLKKAVLIGLVFVFSMCAVLPASALVPAKDLPEVSRWINGAAVDANGIYLSDTWAIDNTGLSDDKFVLINQESTEEMRVKNYPDDVALGNFVHTKTYNVSFDLKLPNDIENEVILTFESSAAEYTVSFNKEDSFSQNASFYPGEYNVTNIEVTRSENTYSLSEAYTLYVTDKDAKASLEIVKALKDENDTQNESPLDVVKAIDSNGDLLWDTIKLFLAVGATFAAYLYIQRKRKKAEEINR